MTPFKKYYIENLQLTESPVRVGQSYETFLDDRAVNVEEAGRVKTEFNYTDTVQRGEGGKIRLDLYRDDSEGMWMDYWITLQPFIACYFIFDLKKDGGLQSLSVWNDREYQATARGLFFDYYMQNFPYVQSDSRHTSRGERYWRTLIKQATDKGHKVVVCDRKNKEYDIDDIDSYWGNIPDFANYTFKIYAK